MFGSTEDTQVTDFSLNVLEQIIANRVGSTAEKSYTKSLLDAGVARVAKKFGEEATEAVIAAVSADRASLLAESADVLYHLLVMLKARDLPFADVLGELERRTSISGHDEKSSRPK